MGVVSELVVAVIDDDDIASWRIQVGPAWIVLINIGSNKHNGSVFCREYLLSIGIIVGVVSSVLLIALAVRPDLDKVIGKGLGEISLVEVLIPVLVSDIPNAVEWKPSGK